MDFCFAQQSEDPEEFEKQPAVCAAVVAHYTFQTFTGFGKSSQSQWPKCVSATLRDQAGCLPQHLFLGD